MKPGRELTASVTACSQPGRDGCLIAHRTFNSEPGGVECGSYSSDGLKLSTKARREKGKVKEIEIDGKRVPIGDLTPDQRAALAAALVRGT